MAPYFSIKLTLLFVLLGNVYTRGTGAIVCWWHLGIHNRIPGKCRCVFLPQLAIAGLGSDGRVPLLHSRFCVFKHLCCPSTQAERVGVLGPQPHFCLSLANTPFTSSSFFLGKCTVTGGFLWPGGKVNLTSQMTTVSSGYPPSKWIISGEADRKGSEMPARVPGPL